jgi:hypothetical protein
MIDLVAITQRVKAFVADADPLTEASNRLALIVASNQPFYPLYIKWIRPGLFGLLAPGFAKTRVGRSGTNYWGYGLPEMKVHPLEHTDTLAHETVLEMERFCPPSARGWRCLRSW